MKKRLIEVLVMVVMMMSLYCSPGSCKEKESPTFVGGGVHIDVVTDFLAKHWYYIMSHLLEVDMWIPIEIERLASDYDFRYRKGNTYGPAYWRAVLQHWRDKYAHGQQPVSASGLYNKAQWEEMLAYAARAYEDTMAGPTETLYVPSVVYGTGPGSVFVSVFHRHRVIPVQQVLDAVTNKKEPMKLYPGSTVTLKVTGKRIPGSVNAPLYITSVEIAAVTKRFASRPVDSEIIDVVVPASVSQIKYDAASGRYIIFIIIQDSSYAVEYDAELVPDFKLGDHVYAKMTLQLEPREMCTGTMEDIFSLRDLKILAD